MCSVVVVAVVSWVFLFSSLCLILQYACKVRVNVVRFVLLYFTLPGHFARFLFCVLKRWKCMWIWIYFFCFVCEKVFFLELFFQKKMSVFDLNCVASWIVMFFNPFSSFSLLSRSVFSLPKCCCSNSRESLCELCLSWMRESPRQYLWKDIWCEAASSCIYEFGGGGGGCACELFMLLLLRHYV